MDKRVEEQRASNTLLDESWCALIKKLWGCPKSMKMLTLSKSTIPLAGRDPGESLTRELQKAQQKGLGQSLLPWNVGTQMSVQRWAGRLWCGNTGEHDPTGPVANLTNIILNQNHKLQTKHTHYHVIYIKFESMHNRTMGCVWNRTYTKIKLISSEFMWVAPPEREEVRWAPECPARPGWLYYGLCKKNRQVWVSCHVKTSQIGGGWLLSCSFLYLSNLQHFLEKALVSIAILKEISPEYSLEGLMLKLKLQYFGHLMWRTDSFEKTLMLGKDWRREEKGAAEDEMVGWYHWLNGHEFE